MRNEPKIIIFDLETLPNLPEVLKVWPQLSNYPGLTLKATINSILCVGWKRYGEKRTYCINAWDFKRWNKDVNDDYEVVKKIREILDDADAVVTQNGKRFDWKFLQTRIMHHGLKPLHKIRHIDTKVVAKSNLFAFNNRLGTLGKLLVDDDKLENGGWDLWVKSHGKDKKALKLMEKYCKQDVKLTEAVFEVLKPLVGNIPNHNLYAMPHLSGKLCCPRCGSTRLKSHGWRYTATTRYKRLRCKDCGGVARTDKKEQLPRAI